MFSWLPIGHFIDNSNDLSVKIFGTGNRFKNYWIGNTSILLNNEFNVNIAQLPFWALTVLFTWRCLKKDKVIDYVFLGLVVGLGILSKYLFIYLMIGIKLVFIYFIKKNKRVKFLHYFVVHFIL